MTDVNALPPCPHCDSGNGVKFWQSDDAHERDEVRVIKPTFSLPVEILRKEKQAIDTAAWGAGLFSCTRREAGCDT